MWSSQDLIKPFREIMADAANVKYVHDHSLSASNLLEDTLEIHPDITYQVLDRDGKLQGEVTAHKFVLSPAS